MESADTPNGWTEIKEIEFWSSTEYRIKPESKSKYRPFKDTEECLKEMQKHQPFGWVKNQISVFPIQQIDIFEKGCIRIDGTWYDLSDIPFRLTFLDGSPFGVKVE